MATGLDKEIKTRTYFTPSTFLYAFDDSKLGGAGNEKDFRVAINEVFGLGSSSPGYIPYVDSSGIYQKGDAGLYFDESNEHLGIGFASAPSPRDVLHLHKATTSPVGIRFSNSDLGVSSSDGQKIQGDSTGLIYDVQSGDSHQYLVGGSEVSRVTTGGHVIGSTSLSASAALEVSSTTRGFLPPRMTNAQRNSITSPAAGLLIYNTSSSEYQFYDGSAWASIGSGGGGSSMTPTTYISEDGINLTTHRLYNTKINPVSDTSIDFDTTNGVNGATGWIFYQAASKPEITLDGSPDNIDILQDNFSSNSLGQIWYCYYRDTDSTDGLLISYQRLNTAPVASNLDLDDGNTTSIEVAQQVTASYDYTDEEGDAESGTIITWYYADDISGTYETQFASSTSAIVSVPSAAEDKYLRFSVQPRSNEGASPGTTISSGYFNIQVGATVETELYKSETYYNLANSTDVGTNGSIGSVGIYNGDRAMQILDTGDKIAHQITPTQTRDYIIKLFVRTGNSASTTAKTGHYGLKIGTVAGGYGNITSESITFTNNIVENVSDFGVSSWGYLASGAVSLTNAAWYFEVEALADFCAIYRIELEEA